MSKSRVLFTIESDDSCTLPDSVIENLFTLQVEVNSKGVWLIASRPSADVGPESSSAALKVWRTHAINPSRQGEDVSDIAQYLF